ncbi:MAG TPA: APC family permease [Solirubrobacteraceae bacterium]|nr:APC family permease [Solirubrobacteraceae bacterium]
MSTSASAPAPTPATPVANLDEGLDRKIGFLGLLWASEASIIGSGWLFGALGAATIAGPSALISWVIATVIVIILALIHAELGGLFPVSGGTSRFPHYAFGSFAGATFGWASYIQAASVAPIEVLAAVQYASSYSWGSNFLNKQGELHSVGLVVAIGLMIVFVLLNLIGIAWLSRINVVVTSWKVIIPVLTVIILLVGHFHGSNFSHGGGFFVKGAAFKDVLIAIPTGGIVFSLLGFEQAVQLAGEARNPAKDLPRAVIASILIGGGLYILIQLAFIAALDPSLLAKAGTWANLTPTSSNAAIRALNQAPFYQVAKLAGIAWLAVILRVDAIISPGGTGLVYETSSSRIAFGLARNGYVPTAFASVSPRTRIPVFAVVVSAIIGLLFLLPFPSWTKLVGVVTSASVLMYAAAPLSLGALRRQKPNLPRPYAVPVAGFMAPLGFVLASLIVYWAGWQTYTTLVVAMLIGYALIALSYALKLNPLAPKMDWQAAPWIGVYFLGMLVLSYISDFGAGGIIGGVGVFKNVLAKGGTQTSNLSLYGGIALVIVFSLVIYYWAMATRLPESKVDEYVKDVYPSALATE